MKSTLSPCNRRRCLGAFPALGLLIGLLAAPGLLCAQSPEEHASHHPGAAPAAGAGGMMEQMGEMMKNLGKPPPKQLCPTLMALPAPHLIPRLVEPELHEFEI